MVGNGGKPELVSHPFSEYDPTKHEIVVINPTSAEVKAIQEKTINPDPKIADRDLLQVITEEYEIDEMSKPEWPDKEVTIGLPPDWHECWISQTPVEPIKKKILKPVDILCKSLKAKSGKVL